MKKTSKIISSFFIITTMLCSVFFILSNKKIEAKEEMTKRDITQSLSSSSPISTDITSESVGAGKVTLTTGGKITIEYTYGYNEMLIYIVPCIKINNSNKSVCDQWAVGSQTRIIHMSGEKNADESKKEKNIHLFNYFDYDDLLKVSIIYQLAYSKGGTFFDPEYCMSSITPSICPENKGKITERIKAFENAKLGGENPLVDYVDKKRLVYEGNGVSNTFNTSFNEIIIKVDNTKMADGNSETDKLINETIIPILWVILGVCAGLSCSVLGYKIVKAADDPQERREKITALRNILIGIAVAAAALMFSNPLVKFFSERL